MRNDTTLESLFPRVRQGVLAATLTQPDKWWFLSELAVNLGTTPSSLQRELSSLVSSGILEQRREGTRVYFRAQKLSPIYRELRGIFQKTAGVVPTLRSELMQFGNKIVSAFMYGSLARAEEGPVSDIDLMVIGQIGLADLSPVLRRIERVLGREVNATVYSLDEFKKKRGEKDHFLTSILSQSTVFIKGSKHELDETARDTGRTKTRHVQTRARQSA